MGKTTKSEKDVLKLIHPGKHIDIYTKPILANEVLKNYPKFCITRPDVFKFPWIVVRHDSLLVLGKVYLLVPKRTLYRLLKANQPPDRSLLPPSSSSLCTSLTVSRLSSPSKKNAGMTPKHQNKLPQWTSKAPLGDDRERTRGRKNSYVELPPSRSVGCNVRRVRYSSSHVHDFYKCGNVASVGQVSGENNGRGGKRKTTSLRSCMRKHGSAPRLANPRVRFSIPGEDIVEPVTKQRTIIQSISRMATTLVVDKCK